MAIAKHRATLAMGVSLGLVSGVFGQEAQAQTTLVAADQPGVLVVYGQRARSQEGDADRLEQIFFSVPAELEDKIYLRLFDPEVSGDQDFTYGGGADSETTFRLFGGEGAFTQAPRPTQAEPGEPVPDRVDLTMGPGPGRLIRERAFSDAPGTNMRWVTLASVRASDGEIVDGRAYFRLDVLGTKGNDGNGFSAGVSLSRDLARAPDGLEMFSYRPTVRWEAGNPPVELWFSNPGGPVTVQSYDAANADLAVVADFEDVPLAVSNQDVWSSQTVTTRDTDLGVSLRGGFETPNDATLSVFDEAGTPLPLTVPPRHGVVPARPVARGAARPLADCQSVAFDASAAQGRVPLSYTWHFGDGQSTTNPVIAHRYDTPGHYTARLEVVEPGERPGRGSAIEVPVHVREAPIAVPGAAIVVAPGDSVAFDGSASSPSDSPITGYGWSFGDGARAQGVAAQHVYARPGQYRAVLRVRDDTPHPCNFGVATREVTVNAPPVAEAGTDQTAEVGQVVTLNGSASYDVDGEITRYSWDMGDGTVLTGDAISHSYAEPGQFSVVLTVTDNSGVSNASSADTMQIGVNAPPQPGFAVPDRPVSVSELAILDASESVDADGQILSYFWDFGDGAIGEGPVVSYAWNQPGTFDVVLTVTDDSGTASAEQHLTRTIRVDAAPAADAGPDQYVTASVVDFDGSLSSDPDGQITEYIWDFGDGNTASGANVSHVYARPGAYEVSLTVRDDSGAPLNVGRDTLNVVINRTPIADAGPPQIVAPGEEFTLSGGASLDPDGRIARHVWTLPDGSQAEGERIAHSQSEPGRYRYALTVDDNFKGGAASDSAEVLVTVNAQPVAEAGADVLVAPGDMVAFDGGQSFDPDGGALTYRWDFDDLGEPLEAAQVERAYPSPGVWSAQLVVRDDSGVLNATASDDVTIRVNHAPVAEAGADITSDLLHVTFDASGSADADGDNLRHVWDFGDGNSARGVAPTHVFAGPGTYPVTLTVDDGTGLGNAQDVDTMTVVIRDRPVADAGGNRDVCSGVPILFDGSASINPDGGLLDYAWDFGDGSGSNLINPSKVYEQPGAYPVTLTVRNETGTEHGSAVDRIAALVREGPIADAGPDLTVCSHQEVRFDGSGSSDADGAVNAFNWTFGDGGEGSGATPAYIFAQPGTYTVTLTITGDAVGECSPYDSDTALVQVKPAPVLGITGPERVGAGLDAPFVAEIAGGGDVANVSWDFGDGTLTEGAEVSHSYAAPGEYLITLRASLASGTEGCTELETKRRIIVNAPPLPAFAAPDSVSVGESVVFDASGSSDPDGAVISYQWDFGDGATETGVAASHVFTQPGEYTATLTVQDDAGVGNSEAQAVRQISVVDAPVAGLTAPAAICPGVPVEWSAPGDASWQFGDVTRDGATVSHSFDAPGLYPVRVTLDDGKGLVGSVVTEQVYARVNSAPVALAGPDRIVCPGEEVTFDAGASADLDGDLTAWEWHFSDGVVLKGARVARSFDQTGGLSVDLIVRDDSGAPGCNTGVDTAQILVNAPPQIDIGVDMTVPVGAAHDVVRFDASTTQDPDGHGTQVVWDFGDGTQAEGAVATHRFAAPGQYGVTATAHDTTGLACGVAQSSLTVTATARD